MKFNNFKIRTHAHIIQSGNTKLKRRMLSTKIQIIYCIFKITTTTKKTKFFSKTLWDFSILKNIEIMITNLINFYFSFQ